MYENIFSDILHMQFILSEIDAKFLHRNVMNIKGCFRNYMTYKMSNYNDNQSSHYGLIEQECVDLIKSNL